MTRHGPCQGQTSRSHSKHQSKIQRPLARGCVWNLKLCRQAAIGKKTACVQCRPNMRPADCATVWVCKCLQLIYLSALPLTLFDIYITIYIMINCFNQTSLSWSHDYLPGAWICVNAMICKRASQVMGFGSLRGQTGWPCSKHGSQRQNCSGAVEIGIW